MVENTEISLVTPEVQINVQKGQQNGIARNGNLQDNQKSPVDGGSRAWVIMLGSFFCNGILFGVINSYGVLYAEFYDNLQSRNVSNAAGKAALVGSFSMGTVFFVSPVSGVLTDLIGLRKTTFIGGAIASSGMLLSSFFIENVAVLCITYGVMYGLGGALAYTPSLAILGHYFKKYLGKVNGFVTAGSSVFTIIMPYLIDAILKRFGIEWTLRTLALMVASIMLIAFLFKPVNIYQKQKKKKISSDDIFNKSLLRNSKYLIWVVMIAFSLFGYFVPYVYMLKFVQKNFEKNVDTKLPIMCIGIASGVGRLLFGFIADLPRVNRIYVQQFSFFSIGVMTMLLPITSGYYHWLVVISLAMGVFDGCFISLLGPIAFDLCGQKGATQAIGFLLGVCAIPLTIGPYVAGVIYDTQKSYTLPFVLAGVPPVITAFGLFLIKFVGNTSEITKGNIGAESAENHETGKLLNGCKISKSYRDDRLKGTRRYSYCNL